MLQLLYALPVVNLLGVPAILVILLWCSFRGAEGTLSYSGISYLRLQDTLQDVIVICFFEIIGTNRFSLTS
jgi:hypothetical protein